MAAESLVEVPDYVVGERLGAGGFGEVFAARHRVLGREVAIKILHTKYSAHPEAVARFIAEGRAVNKVLHPGIVQIFDFGTLVDGRHYFVMERLHGTTLRALLRERTLLPLAEALPILRGIAEAVDAAHAAGIAHRDLKPDNVFLLDNGTIKLIDFGLAKLTGDDAGITETGSVFGTPLYMSPEQCRGSAAEGSTDAYSFGAVAYHVLVGEPPFAGEPLALALHHLNDAPVVPSKRNPELSPRVDRVLTALLAKDPTERPLELVSAVSSLVEDTPLSRRPHRRRALAYVLAAVALGAIAIGAWNLREHDEPPRVAPVPLREVPTRRPLYTVSEVTARPNGKWSSLVFTAGGRVAGVDDTAVWEVDIGGGRAKRLPEKTVDLANDGSPILQKEDASDVPSFTKDGVSNVIAAAFSPDRSAVAGYDQEGRLVIVNRDGGDVRRSTERYAMPLVWNWSPSGEHLAMTQNVEGGPSLIVDVDARTLKTTTYPLASLHADHYGAAFLDEEHVVFCSLTGAKTTLESLDLRSGAHEPLLEIPRSTYSCQLSVNPETGRILLTSTPAIAVFSVLRPGGAQRSLETLRGPPELMAPAAISDDGREAWVYGPTDPVQLYRVSLETSDAKIETHCKGDRSVLLLRGELMHVTVDTHRIGFFGPTCEERVTWSLPEGTWRTPRCDARRCATAGLVGDNLEIWELQLSGKTKRIFSREAFPRSPRAAFPHPMLALSPDGTYAVAMGGQGGRLYVVNLVTGAATTPIKKPEEINLEFVGWTNDPKHFVASGFMRGSSLAMITQFSLDGTEEKALWTANNIWFSQMMTSPTSSLILGIAQDLSAPPLLLEPTK